MDERGDFLVGETAGDVPDDGDVALGERRPELAIVAGAGLADAGNVGLTLEGLLKSGPDHFVTVNDHHINDLSRLEPLRHTVSRGLDRSFRSLSHSILLLLSVRRRGSSRQRFGGG